MDLESAIQALNEVSGPQINVLTTRDGRTRATLPRIGREVLIGDSQFKEEVKVTPSDLAWICEEARRAIAPGLSLLEAALSRLNELDTKPDADLEAESDA